MKRECPLYRLRLFLSVDLVGSTRFKSRGGRRHAADEIDPLWVKQIKLFYKSIPELVSTYFESESKEFSDLTAEHAPKIWKTIGDEIVFCCAVMHLEHLASCVASFLKTLEEYGRGLDEAKDLDIKGTGWIAAFPVPNITVSIPDSSNGEPFSGESTDEKFERKADINPDKFDFLGTDIDSGFRVSRHARPDAFAATAELALLLTRCAHRRIRPFAFTYSGREILKGVLNDRPYPLIGIDTERNLSRREVRIRERAIGSNDSVDPLSLHDFLDAFLKDEGIDPPRLNGKDEEAPRQSAIYQGYAERWQRDEEEPDPASARGDSPIGEVEPIGEIPKEVTEAANDMTAAADEKA